EPRARAHAFHRSHRPDELSRPSCKHPPPAIRPRRDRRHGWRHARPDDQPGIPKLIDRLDRIYKIFQDEQVLSCKSCFILLILSTASLWVRSLRLTFARLVSP